MSQILNSNKQKLMLGFLKGSFNLLQLNIIFLLLSITSFAQDMINGPSSLNPTTPPQTYYFSTSPVQDNNSLAWSCSEPTMVTLTPGLNKVDVSFKPYGDNAAKNIQLTATWTVAGSSKSTSILIKRGPYIAIDPFSGSQYVYPNESFTYRVYDPNGSGAVSRKYTWSAPGSLYQTTSKINTQSVTWPAQNPCKVLCTYDVVKNNTFSSYNLSVTSILKLRIPGVISGPTTVICGSTNPISYSVPAVAGALKYTWTLPVGWQFSGPSTGNSITVIPSAAIPSTPSEQVCVRAENVTLGLITSYSCITIKRTPDAPTFINPATNVCVTSLPKLLNYNVVPVSGATSYSWAGTDFGRIPPTGTSATAWFWNKGIYTLNVKAINACGSSPSSSINVTIASSVLSEPGAVYYMQLGTSCYYFPYISAVPEAVSYDWSFDNFSTINSTTTLPENNSMLLAPNTTYEISVRAKNSCVSGPFHTTTVQTQSPPPNCMWKTVTSVETLMNTEEGLSIFPNPANTYIEVGIPNNKNIVGIKVINMEGQLIKEVFSSESKAIIQVSDIPAGLYIINVKSDNFNTVKKIQIIK